MNTEEKVKDVVEVRPQEVVVNDDFSFTGKDGKRYTLQPKQKLFAESYLAMGGDRIEAVIEAGYDVNFPNSLHADRRKCSTMAYELLTKLHITAYINFLLAEYGFNSGNVEEQHLFLLNQHADLKMKGKAIDMFYKLKGKYPKETKNELNINVFSLADLADKSAKRKQMGLPPVEAIEAEVTIIQPEPESVGNHLEPNGFHLETEGKGREGKRRE